MSGTIIQWTLAGEYLVTGEVTGFEYETLPGVELLVTNLETDEDASASVDEDGTYSVDLGNTTDYPTGYSIGDEVLISVTHREATRSWKRRVSGSEIVQDLHFTHGTWLGAMRKAKLVATHVFTNPSGTTLTIPNAFVRGVLALRRNGEELAASAWSFARPATISLASAASSSDVYEADVLIHRTEAEAKSVLVTDGDAPVRNAVTRYYATLASNRVPELQDLSESLAASALRHRVFSGGDKVDGEARMLSERATQALDEIRKGSRGLTDQDGAFVSPSAQTATAPRSNTTPARKFERWDLERRSL